MRECRILLQTSKAVLAVLDAGFGVVAPVEDVGELGEPCQDTMIRSPP